MTPPSAVDDQVSPQQRGGADRAVPDALQGEREQSAGMIRALKMIAEMIALFGSPRRIR